MLGKVAATEGILPFGGVWTTDTLSDKLADITPEERKTALVAQLQYQKKVLGAKGSPNLFYKSSQNVEFTTEKLQSNLMQVLELNKITTENVQGNELHYHQPAKITINIGTSKNAMSHKIAEQRNRIKSNQQQQLLPLFLEQYPDTLVGKSVKHKCKNEDGTVEWFCGLVTAIHSLKCNVLFTEFDITYMYDDFPEDTWNFPLLGDLKKGDLIIKT